MKRCRPMIGHFWHSNVAYIRTAAGPGSRRPSARMIRLSEGEFPPSLSNSDKSNIPFLDGFSIDEKMIIGYKDTDKKNLSVHMRTSTSHMHPSSLISQPMNPSTKK